MGQRYGTRARQQPSDLDGCALNLNHDGLDGRAVQISGQGAGDGIDGEQVHLGREAKVLQNCVAGVRGAQAERLAQPHGQRGDLRSPGSQEGRRQRQERPRVDAAGDEQRRFVRADLAVAVEIELGGHVQEHAAVGHGRAQRLAGLALVLLAIGVLVLEVGQAVAPSASSRSARRWTQLAAGWRSWTRIRVGSSRSGSGSSGSLATLREHTPYRTYIPQPGREGPHELRQADRG